MRVLIVGAGNVGYYLAKTLLASGHVVSVLEQDQKACESVARDIGVLVVRGDGSKVRDLADAGADRADVVAAVTRRDADNLVICQLAKKKFGVPRTIARVSNPQNEQVFRSLGVDVVVSSTSLIAASIEQKVVSDEVRTVLSLERGNMFLVETIVGQGAMVANQAIRDLGDLLPPDCIIVTIVRKDKALIPRGSTVLEPGDEVFALTSAEGRKRLRRLFGEHVPENGGMQYGK